MRAVGVFALVCLGLPLAACGGGASNAPPGPSTSNQDDGGAEVTCIDDDGDGFGNHCQLGSDCDDADPAVTDECRRCVLPTKDCPCKSGTRAVSCAPPVQRVMGGTLVCREGNRYCRSGYWSDCETIGQYVFVADP
jgi:hypothetical protein